MARTDIASVWATWYLGDLSSALVIAPAIVLWVTSGPRQFDRMNIRDTALISAVAIVVGILAFSPLVKASGSPADALPFLAVLPLMWASLRGRQRDTATASIILSCFAVWGVLAGQGPFARADQNASFLLLVAFITTASVPTLVLSADVSARRRTENALRESEARLRNLTDRLPNAAVYQMIFDGQRRYYTYASRGIERIRGVSAEAVLADPLLLRRQVLPQYLPALEAADAEASGKLAPFEHEFEVRLPSGEVRWLHLSSAPRRLADGRIAWEGVQLDITERKQSDERQRLLAREIDHRAKNLLAVVQSILNLSRAEDTASFVATVKGRVMAMARAHELLSGSRWKGADLRRLVEEELDPYRTSPGRVFIDGPRIALSPLACQPMALALHELATNAIKVGSLSASTGTVSVDWTIDARGLTLSWQEAGGPRIDGPPTRRGFGSTVLIGSIERQLQGRVTMDWRSEGLKATLFIPAGQLASTDMASAATTLETRPAASLAGRRILVVEDEPLLAMDIAASLKKAGCKVVGPALTLGQALQFAEHEPLDGAVLDRNLAGHSSEPVAARLKDRRIPFAVISGYVDADLSAEFGDVLFLAKPFEPGELLALIGRLEREG